MSYFDVCIDRLLSSEGDYVNPKPEDDPGGETKFGISKRSYPNLYIKGLTRADAIQIYWADFWQRIHGDELPPGLAFLMFDFAVNSGVEIAIRKAQEALGVADDGHWGPVTRKAADLPKGWLLYDVCMRYVAARMKFQARLSNFKANAAGWTNRNADNIINTLQDIAP